MEPPSEFRCPISMEPMVDPVLCEDGHTYERQNILEWISRSPTSPLTRQPLNSNNIRPNLALKAAIQRWKVQEMTSKKSVVTTVPIKQQPIQPILNPSYQQQPQQSYNQTAIVIEVSQQARQEQMTLNQQRKVKVILICMGFFVFIVVISSIFSIKSKEHLNDDD
jgi:hypothetical protein